MFISYNLLGGRKVSEIKLNIIHNGIENVVHLIRSIELFKANEPEYKENQIWKIIDGNIGYVNLSLLLKPMVDSMFADLSDTKAIIFDNRGYPLGTARDIVSHLTDKTFCEAVFTTNLVMSPDNYDNINDNYSQITVLQNKSIYKGEIIVLVNEQTQSQAEFLCMVLQGASKRVKIIGSQTSGAIGTVSGIILPGGISTYFTCQRVCDDEGKNIQGKGIVPDIIITPTIKGIISGVDEVLQKAIEYVNIQK